jgi:diguanylate cyclase (GGDEF)-like protein/PAS domain S-box-containing protein
MTNSSRAHAEHAAAIARLVSDDEVRTLVDQIPTGFVMAEAPSGRIVVFNDQASRILGHPLIPADDVEDYSRYGAVHSDGRLYEPEEHPLARALAGRYIYDERVLYRRGDGVVITLSVNAGPLHDDRGRVIAAALTMSDVTAQQSVEARLRTRLEALVEQRTHELVRRTSELDRANAALRALSESLEATVRERTAELEASRVRLEHEAQHDSLTGLPNRVRLQERLERSIAGAGRNGHRVAVMFLDLDGFKDVNDAYGHGVGDDVLRQAARRLRDCLPADAMLARLGGDEFMVLLTGLTDAAAADVVARGLVATLEGPFDAAGAPARITVSVGVTVYPEDGLDATTLQRRADAAMYRAKGAGGNRVHHFGVGPDRD